MESLVINIVVGIFLAMLTGIAWFVARTLTNMESTFQRFEASINKLNNNVIILLEHKRLSEEEKKVLWQEISDLKTEIKKIELTILTRKE